MTLKRIITAVDTHSGIPMRVITGGVDHIPGATVLDKVLVRPRSWPPGADVAHRLHRLIKVVGLAAQGSDSRQGRHPLQPMQVRATFLAGNALPRSSGRRSR